MRHYDNALYPEAPDVVPWPAASGPPFHVQRECVAPLIDELDCLLAVWVAEAMLDSGTVKVTTGGVP